VATVVLLVGKPGKYGYARSVTLAELVPRLSGSAHAYLPFDRFAGHDSEQF
jgi:hypothetical protein